MIINPFDIIIGDKKEEGRPHQRNSFAHKKREQNDSRSYKYFLFNYNVISCFSQ